MKQLKCLDCGKKWYIDDSDLNFINTCPFCSTLIRHKGTIGKVDTLGKAIYKAISDQGLDILTSAERVSGYLWDIIPDLKKEVRIFTKTFNDDYIALYRAAFSQKENEIALTMGKLRSLFIEEEGLSETWANTLCENCQTAISYYSGQGLSDLISAEILDIEFEQCLKSTIDYKIGDEIEFEQRLKSTIDYKIGDEIQFGKHENGKPMHWRILDIDNERVLLHYAAVDLQRCFHNEYINVSWKDCQLRKWLNGEFIVSHFSYEEQKALLEVNIGTKKFITQDKVFCLSRDEAYKYENFIKPSYAYFLRDRASRLGRCVIGGGNFGAKFQEVLSNHEYIVRPAMYISTSYFLK